MTESSRARSGYADSNRGRNPTPVLLLLIYFYLTLTALIYIYVGIREVTMVHIPQLVRDTRERLRTFKFAGRGKDARQPAQEKKGESSAVKDKVVVKSESRPVPLTRKLTFNDLSQEVYEIISYSLTQADLLNMCLVSKHCLAHFERALYRTVILLPPEDSKWNKRSALFYLDPRFAEHTQDLRIVFRGRDKVRCSLPVSGDRCVKMTASFTHSFQLSQAASSWRLKCVWGWCYGVVHGVGARGWCMGVGHW